MQHDSADRCEGITEFFWNGKLPWQVYPSLSYSVCATHIFVHYEHSLRLVPEHDAAFSNLKKAISSNEVLRYYYNTKPLVIQVDDSQRGLGAALLQANGPIAFASKSLTETESRYSNIDREMLGIVFGLE